MRLRAPEGQEGRLSGWVYVDIRGRDLRSAVTEMQQRVLKEVKVPSGYSISWFGQFEYLERATERLKVVVPATLAVIFLLLFLIFRNPGEAALIMIAVPFALAGGFWLIWLLGHAIAVASAGRVHRACGSCSGVRRRHAGLSQERVAPAV